MDSAKLCNEEKCFNYIEFGFEFSILPNYAGRPKSCGSRPIEEGSVPDESFRDEFLRDEFRRDDSEDLGLSETGLMLGH